MPMSPREPKDEAAGATMGAVFVYPTTGPHHRAAINDTNKFVNCSVVEIVSKQRQYQWGSECPLACPVQTLSQRPEALLGRDCTLASEARDYILAQHARVVFTTRYDLPLMRAIANEARTRGAASVLMTDSTELDHPWFWAKEWLKRRLLQSVYDAVLVAGSRSQDYALRLGFDPSRLWTCVDVVDNHHFETQSTNARIAEAATQTELALPRSYFLAVGRHAPEKNFEGLLRAFSLFSHRVPDYKLVMCGAGPLSEDLKKLASSLGIFDRVIFAGWTSYSRLPAYYALAQAVVLPSFSEPWGLVVNEAMACGTPVIASRRCGCVPELVSEGITGYSFDPHSTRALTELLFFAASDKFDGEMLSAQARIKVMPYSLRARSLAVLDILRVFSGRH